MHVRDLELIETATEQKVVHDLDIIRLVDVTGDGAREIQGFRRKVALLFSTDSRMSVSHGGIDFHTGSNFTDFYGFLMSVEGAVEEAMEFADTHRVDASSSLLIEVRTRLLAAAVSAEPVGAGRRGSKYRRVPNDWHLDTPEGRKHLDGRRRGYVHPGQDGTLLSRMFPEDQDGTAVWSSRNRPEENEGLLEIFRQDVGRRMEVLEAA